MTTARLQALCRSFPSLDAAPGIEPWESAVLDAWAAGHKAAANAVHAAAFVLELCEPATDWRVGPFEFRMAFRDWDEDHCEAFLAWARSPWWPRAMTPRGTTTPRRPRRAHPPGPRQSTSSSDA